MKTRIDELLTSFRRIYLEPDWIEFALQDVLTDVDKKLAFINPPGDRNSMAKIVCYLVFIRQNLIKELTRTFHRITEILQAAEPRLFKIQALPRNYALDYLIARIFQQENYYLGQLFLKNQLQQLALNK